MKCGQSARCPLLVDQTQDRLAHIPLGGLAGWSVRIEAAVARAGPVKAMAVMAVMATAVMATVVTPVPMRACRRGGSKDGHEERTRADDGREHRDELLGRRGHAPSIGRKCQIWQALPPQADICPARV
jgi:hypothetical protein